jgi:transcriptional regulator with XRE-family HTH domain
MNELIELGVRIRGERIRTELKQRDLADRAAVSKTSLSALENGSPVTTATLARVLGALGHHGALTDILPPTTVSPLDLQKLAGKQRRRVR